MPRIRMMGACFVLVLSLSGCIGNTDGTCESGETCECDQIGNCSYNCPDGNCSFRCKGTGNCTFECEGGGCDLVCENTGNCIMDCPGDDCAITCLQNTGNCILNKCTAGCDRDGGPVKDQQPPKGDQQVKVPDGPTPPPDAGVDGPVVPYDGCVPKTCAQLGKNCGQQGDGCGKTLDCGTCNTGTCGGGGTPGVCGCPGSTTTTANPTLAQNLATVGVASWITPGNVISANAGSGSIPSGVARVQLWTGHTPSHYLVAKGFGLNIPAGSTINGIEVDLRRRTRYAYANIADHQVLLTYNGALQPGSTTAPKTWTNNWIYASYGGKSDLWGRTWSAAQLNDASFGVVLSVAHKGTSGNNDAFVDHVRVIVHYAPTCTCAPDTCGSKSYSCGTHPDGCGSSISCGTCSSGTCVKGQCCTPATCSSLGFSCGSHSDGCGGTINCGTCSSGPCISGKCCLPATCSSLSFSCGSHSDGCGGTVTCGPCAPGDTCTAGICGCLDGTKSGGESDVDCGGVCAQKCGQGKTCGIGTDCANTFCVDGVCCNSSCSGFCKACVNSKTGAATGTCANVTTGTDPDSECSVQLPATCGTTGVCGAGACALHPLGTVCAPASCTGGVEQAADTCDGAGTCADKGSVTCAALYSCGTSTCQSCADGAKNGNETDVDCGGGGSCAACGQGKACALTTDCTSGACVDGVCCDNACAGLCKRCDLTGKVGTCSNIEGSDPDIECPGKKVCSGGACL
jgi:hypothetical protein